MYIELESLLFGSKSKINCSLIGLGKPEPLTGYYSGYWSRTIDEKNRLIYRIRNDIVEIAQCKDHYNDK